MYYRVDAEAAAKALLEHRMQWSHCDACGLHQERITVVQGMGPAPCNLAIVGSWPGRDDDSQGRPFAGPVGNHLDTALKSARYPREKAFLTSILACRVKDGLEPRAEATAACLPRLHRELQCIAPVIILAMGKFAAAALLGKATVALDDVLGVLTPVTIQGVHTSYKVSMLATHHPAHILRVRDEGSAEYRDIAQETFRHICMAVDIANAFERMKGETHG